MTKSHRFGLITMTLVCAGMAVSPARADLTQIYGTYYGSGSYTVENVVDGQIVSEDSGGVGSMYVQAYVYELGGNYFAYYGQLIIGGIYVQFGQAYGNVGPQSAVISYSQPPGSPEGGVGNFGGTYQSIDPTGQLVTAATDTAGADFTQYDLSEGLSGENGQILIASFSGFGAPPPPPVPEPSTLALAVSAIAMAIGLHASRGLLARVTNQMTS
jgi:hypothetical protein